MVRRPSVLACLLYVGESSLETAIHSLEAQDGVDLRIILIGHYPEAEAHERLFRTLSDNADRHDVLVFFGSDMRIVEPNLLKAIATVFDRYPEVGRTIFGVDDWMSGERILGLESWRRGTRWRTAESDLFPDVVRNSATGKLKLVDPGRPLVMHAEEPSDNQAVRYGLHRAVKAAVAASPGRWSQLRSFAHFVAAEPHPQRLLALAAVEYGLRDPDSGRKALEAKGELDHGSLAELRSRSSMPELLDHVHALIAHQSEFIGAVHYPSPDGPAAARLSRSGKLFRSRLLRLARGLRQDRPLPEDLRGLALRDFFGVLDDR